MSKTRFFEPRNLTLISILIIVFSLGVSFFYEYYYNFKPCVLCTLQRICFIVLLFFLILKKVLRIYKPLLNIFPMIFIFLGILLSGRQIFLQNNNSQGEESYLCSPILETSFNVDSINFYIEKIFSTKGSCAEVTSTLLGLSFASWSLMIFIFLLTFTLIATKEERNM
tara:strand:+ start:6716 stop:7219 length:504 start_codon:yes stop_codon:yes gene_type:complete